MLRSMKARESAQDDAREGRAWILGWTRNAKRRAEQGRPGQAREQCPFEESSPSSLSRLLATQGMHAVTRLHAISLSFSPLRSLAFYGRAVRRESLSRVAFHETIFPPLRLNFPPCTCRARVPSIRRDFRRVVLRTQ